MTLTTCPDCARPVSDAAKACPNCGRPRSASAWRLLKSLRTFAWRKRYRIFGAFASLAIVSAAVFKVLAVRDEKIQAAYWASLKPDSTINVSTYGVGARYKYLYRKDDRDLTDIIVKRTRYDSTSYRRYDLNCGNRGYRFTAESSDSSTLWRTTPSRGAWANADTYAPEPISALLRDFCDPLLRESAVRLESIRAQQEKPTPR